MRKGSHAPPVGWLFMCDDWPDRGVTGSSPSIMQMLFFMLLPLMFLTASCGLDQIVSDTLDNPGDPVIPNVTAPTAIISSPEIVPVRTNVTLDGTNSGDPNNLSLTYEWALAEQPFGSEATLANTTSALTTLFVDKGGYYSITLKVTNSGGDISEVVAMRTDAVGTGRNHPPVAIVSTTPATGAAILDASSSYDIDRNPLFYRWEIVNPPVPLTPDQNITAYIDDPYAATTFLISNVASTFAIRLTVHDTIDFDESFLTVSVTP